jgi:hypothetical protein
MVGMIVFRMRSPSRPSSPTVADGGDDVVDRHHVAGCAADRLRGNDHLGAHPDLLGGGELEEART